MLDIRTLTFVTLLFSLILGGGLFLFCFLEKKHKSIYFFSAADLLLGFSFLLLSLRSMVPDFLSVVWANTLICLAFYLMHWGAYIFRKIPPRFLVSSGVVLLPVIGIFCYFTYIYPHINYRILIIMVFLIQESVISGAVFIQSSRKDFRIQNLSAALSFFIFALYALFRGIWVLNESLMMDFMQAGWVHGIAVIVLDIHIVLYTFAVLWITASDVIQELRNTRKEVNTLQGIIPICSRCKKIRDDQGYWQMVELYVRNHSDAEFSHGLCPECIKILYPEI